MFLCLVLKRVFKNSSFFFSFFLCFFFKKNLLLIITSTDGSRERVSRVGFTEHFTTSLDSVFTDPDHADNGAREHVFDEFGEEGTSSQVSVVLKEEEERTFSLR